MGYTTEYFGGIKVIPPLDFSEQSELQSFSNKRHEGEGLPDYYCQWVPSDDGEFIVWDGGEKFYEGPKWMKHIIENMFPTHKFEGEIEAQGEEVGDHWYLVVQNNKVYTAPARGGYDPDNLEEVEDL